METRPPICGIVMPISSIHGCSESHWSDVMDIISEAIIEAEFTPNIVSHADDVGIIHKRIIQNLYDNPIIVCDVSGKNANVMFELGMRLAFDKPTIIIKDDKTSYSFDTSAIEHLEYPRDLRFTKIVDFKQKLTEKIIATHKKAVVDKDYTTFLKQFGEFTVAKIKEKEVTSQEYIFEEIKEIGAMVMLSRNDRSANYRKPMYETTSKNLIFNMDSMTEDQQKEFMSILSELPGIAGYQLAKTEEGKNKIYIKLRDGVDVEDRILTLQNNFRKLEKLESAVG